MARHNIYVSDEHEQLIATLGLDREGWSRLFLAGVSALIAQMPEAKVERAARRVARDKAAESVERLLPARGE